MLMARIQISGTHPRHGTGGPTLGLVFACPRRIVAPQVSQGHAAPNCTRPWQQAGRGSLLGQQVPQFQGEQGARGRGLRRGVSPVRQVGDRGAEEGGVRRGGRGVVAGGMRGGWQVGGVVHQEGVVEQAIEDGGTPCS